MGILAMCMMENVFFFIRTSASGGTVSTSQMSCKLLPLRAEPVKRVLLTFSSL